MEVTRTFDLLERYHELYLQKPDALSGKENGKWVTWSTKDYIEQATRISYGFLALGMKKGDMVVTISNNRPEWNIMDMGLSQAGLVHVPVYPTISKEDYDFILNHAQPKYVIVSDKQLYAKIKPIVAGAPSIIDIFTFDKVEGAKYWKEILELGKENEVKLHDNLQGIKASIVPGDLVTLLYTSGTTGFPKGVMLSHNNLVTNMITSSKVHHLNHHHKVLSFLPISHVYERTANYQFQYKGLSIFYAESMATILPDLLYVKPQIFSTVPRLLEKVYDKIIGKGKDLPYIKKQIFFWAVNLGMRYDPHKNSAWYNFRLKIARKIIFSKWQAALGGNVEIIVSGGAALQARLATIFWAADMKVLEGYGLTETSPVISITNLTTMEIKFGTVGPVIENVRVKIAEDGEILCKGPNVMLGYYKAPDLTAEVIDSEGWFHTGDIGIFEDGKYLKITDRKKEIFKLNSGKYVAPQVIENKLKESFFIENVMVIGENEKFASALISPNYEFLHNWAGVHGIKFRDNEELIANPLTIARLQKEVTEMNKNIGLTEQIKRFRLVPEEWTPASGEMSPTLKLKRKVLDAKYKDLIAEIYSVDKAGID
jgi:long-chain acyl-CoA synthetase